MLHHLVPSKQNESIPSVPPEGQKEEWKALKPRVKTEFFFQLDTTQSGKHVVICGGKWEMGQESEL
jgi:hypothetical protein